MKSEISAVLLVSKQHHQEAVNVAAEVTAWFEDRGVETRNIWSHQRPEDIAAMARGVSLVIILGGDGIMLGVGRALAGLNIPLVGINFGRVGFLTEIPAASWREFLPELLDGNFVRQEYLALDWQLTDGQNVFAQGAAVNDVVLARAEVARAISLELEIDGQTMSRLRCDGAIVSAPLGATAYTASAGGPLVFPGLSAQIITPISPFAGSFPPLVMPDTAVIRLHNSTPGQDVRLTVDGQEFFNVETGQFLEVCGKAGQVIFLARDPAWYLKRLRERGFILAGPGSGGQN